MEYLAIYSDDALAHHGIKGQKWGVRRYQNPDGTLTVEGKRRYSTYAQPGSLENPYTARKTAQIHRSVEKLDAAVSKANSRKKDNGSWRAMDNLKVNYRTNQYLKKTGNRYINDLGKITTIAGALGGPVASVIAAAAYEHTSSGRAAVAEYKRRREEVRFAADVNSQVETQRGREFLEEAWKKAGMPRRPDRY